MSASARWPGPTGVSAAWPASIPASWPIAWKAPARPNPVPNHHHPGRQGKAKQGFQNEPTMHPNPKKPRHLPPQKTNPPAVLQPPLRAPGACLSAGGGMPRCSGSAHRSRPAAPQRPIANSQTGFHKRTHHAPQSPRNHATYPSENEPKTNPPVALQLRPRAAGECPSAGGGLPHGSAYLAPCPRSLSSTDRGTATFPLIPVPN
jgi:hypothetical protein